MSLNCEAVEAAPDRVHIELHCPHCQGVLAKVFAETWETPRGTFWLHDERPVALDFSGFDEGQTVSEWGSASLGTCPDCLALYAVVELAVLSQPVLRGSHGFDYLMGWRLGSDYLNWQASLPTADRPEQTALLTRCRTPYGVRDHYLFGPVIPPSPDAVDLLAGSATINPGSVLLETAREIISGVLPTCREENAKAAHESLALSEHETSVQSSTVSDSELGSG